MKKEIRGTERGSHWYGKKATGKCTMMDEEIPCYFHDADGLAYCRHYCTDRISINDYTEYRKAAGLPDIDELLDRFGC